MPPKVVRKADIEAAKRKANHGSPSPVYGAWEKFKPPVNHGYAWFPFDVINWLTSPVVNAMTPNEQGIFVRLLAVQWRDGYLSTNLKSLAAQTGLDVRTCANWFTNWGELFVCLDHPEGNCDLLANLRGAPRASECVGAPPIPSEGVGGRRTCSVGVGRCVNGELHFLAIKQGKLSLGGGPEESREKGDAEQSIFTAVSPCFASSPKKQTTTKPNA